MIRHSVPLFVGALSLAIAVLSFARGELVVAASAAALFGVVLLGLATYVLARVGSNYRQLRSEHEELLRQTRDIAATVRIDDDQLTEIVDRMTPIITKMVARDRSINANRVAARYEVIEAELRQLLDDFDERAAEQRVRPARQDADDRNGQGHRDRSRLGD